MISAAFNGNGYEISNLKITGNKSDNNESRNQAFFHAVTNASIDGLGLVNVDISPDNSVARQGSFSGMVRFVSDSTIRNSYVIGDIRGNANLAGLASLVFLDSTIINSYFIGTLRSLTEDMNETVTISGLGIASTALLEIENSRAIGRIETKIRGGNRFFLSMLGKKWC